MCIQIYEYLSKIFSKWQCSFSLGYSSQQCLLVMIEIWRQSLDKGRVSVALVTDLFKGCDCMLHDLLTANGLCKCCCSLWVRL